MAGRWFSPGNTISNTNKIDRQDNLNIIESDVKHHNHNPKLILKQIYYLNDIENPHVLLHIFFY